MAEKYTYCNRHFNPEAYPEEMKCDKLNPRTGYCNQIKGYMCFDELKLTPTEARIMQSLRIVKAQNAKILELLQKQK